jgi:hypothetical protein
MVQQSRSAKTRRTIMQILTLNIGLETNTGESLDRLEVLTILTRNQFRVHASETRQSATEQTLIVRGYFTDNTRLDVSRIHALSLILKQDCIAVSPDDGKTGELIGPNAQSWGEFNPAYFLSFNAKDFATI